MKLIDRIERYLKNENCPVHENIIVKVAQKVGYAPNETRDALRTLSKRLYIGSWYVGKSKLERQAPGMYYQWHPMTPEEIKKLEEDIAWFDNL